MKKLPKFEDLFGTDKQIIVAKERLRKIIEKNTKPRVKSLKRKIIINPYLTELPLKKLIVLSVLWNANKMDSDRFASIFVSLFRRAFLFEWRKYVKNRKEYENYFKNLKIKYSIN